MSRKQAGVRIGERASVESWYSLNWPLGQTLIIVFGRYKLVSCVLYIVYCPKRIAYDVPNVKEKSEKDFFWLTLSFPVSFTVLFNGPGTYWRGVSH